METARLNIRVLPADVAARIAAGEVVERPASVVKELVENSLDAGATRVSVELVEGGLETIRITDDGIGIAPDELQTAFARHATSKLRDDIDLSRIMSLGFRGEALPSIAAVAEVEIASRPSGAQAAGYLRLVPGQPPDQGTRGAPEGTTVTVRGLFERVPARKKFLRARSTETGAIASVVTHYALAYPEVRFALTTDGRRSLETPGSGDLRDAIGAVYGPEVAAAVIDVRGESHGIAVHGLAAPPHISRASRGYISLFVNRRWIQNRRLAYAVEEAYQGLLMVGRRPIAVLNIDLPPEEVDVNVHPTKAEVRFLDESAVFGAIQRSIRTAVLDSAPVPATDRTMDPPGDPALSPQATMPPLWTHALDLSSRSAAGPEARQPDATALPEPALSGTPGQALPVLRVIGQFGSAYIIAEGPDGMYLIDQHAAHERVLYERFWQRRAQSKPDVQGLLEPVTLDMTPRQLAAVSGAQDLLPEHGFDVEPFGDGAYVIRSVPQSLATGDVRDNITRFLDRLIEEPEGDRRDRVAMSLACHGAIRAGKNLSIDEMRDLVRQLETTESPNTCPHGRPTMLHMSGEMLARQFGRR